MAQPYMLAIHTMNTMPADAMAAQRTRASAGMALIEYTGIVRLYLIHPKCFNIENES